MLDHLFDLKRTSMNNVAVLYVLFIFSVVDKGFANEENPKDAKPFEGVMKSFENFFENTASDAQEKSASGMESLSNISEEIKEKAGSGLDFFKSFAGGLGDQFSKAKEKVEDAGEKVKETIGDAALNVKEEVETAGSKISKHAQDAASGMMSMFGK